MTLSELFHQRGWPDVLKRLVGEGLFGTTASGESVVLAVIAEAKGAETWGEGGEITVVAAGTAADTGAIVTQGKSLDIHSDVNCYIKIAATTDGNADANDYPILANTLYRVPLTSGFALFAFRDAVAGDAIIKYHPAG